MITVSRFFCSSQCRSTFILLLPAARSLLGDTAAVIDDKSTVIATARCRWQPRVQCAALNVNPEINSVCTLPSERGLGTKDRLSISLDGTQPCDRIVPPRVDNHLLLPLKNHTITCTDCGHFERSRSNVITFARG